MGKLSAHHYVRAVALLFLTVERAVAALTCRVDHKADRTTYRLSLHPGPDCESDWAGNGKVLVQGGAFETGVVLEASKDEMSLKSCMADVSSTLYCVRDGKMEKPRKASCTTTCPITVMPLAGDEGTLVTPSDFVGGDQPEAQTCGVLPLSTCIPVVAVVLLVVGLVVGGIAVFIRYRNSQRTLSAAGFI